MRLLLSTLVGILGLWYITRNITWGDITAAWQQARIGYVFLAVLVILATILTKSWRWRLMFVPPEAAPPLGSLYSALILGQFVNALSPARVGDLARIYALERSAPHGKVRIFSTLVIEKTLDVVTTLVTLFLVGAAVILPGYGNHRTLIITSLALVSFVGMLLLAYQTHRALRLVEWLAGWLPGRLRRPVMKLVAAGLEGLSALRAPRLTLLLMLVSASAMFLAVLTPRVLFLAFDIPLGFRAAALVHLTLSIGSIPASTPGNVGIFEALVAFMLHQLGLDDDGVILGYAIVYHLVAVTPQIVLGAVAATQSNWGWFSKNRNTPV